MVRVKVKKIDIHNFLSFQDEEWDFDNTNRLVLIKGINKDTTFLLGNTSNGSGKSAWSHALMYSLFGQLSGKIHNSNLKNKFADELRGNWKMFVSIEVDSIISNTDVKHWKIIRGIQKGSSTIVLQLLILEDGEWKDISKSTSANTQKYIEDNVLFMNFEMYQRLVMLSVDDKYNFFKLNAGQKRDFVETLFDTSIYSKMYTYVNEKRKTRSVQIMESVSRKGYMITAAGCDFLLKDKQNPSGLKAIDGYFTDGGRRNINYIESERIDAGCSKEDVVSKVERLLKEVSASRR